MFVSFSFNTAFTAMWMCRGLFIRYFTNAFQVLEKNIEIDQKFRASQFTLFTYVTIKVINQYVWDGRAKGVGTGICTQRLRQDYYLYF
jgi:hypothetical protein